MAASLSPAVSAFARTDTKVIGQNSQGSVDPFAALPANVAEMMRAQIAPSEAARSLRPVVDADNTGGYMNLLLDGGVVLLRWKGTPPATVTAAVERARAIAPVRVESVDYSYAELDAAADRIIEQHMSKGSADVHTVTILGDGSGLRVTKKKGAPASTIYSAGIPVQVATADEPQFLSRNNDSAPWWGGSSIWNTNGRGACSSAFGVTNATGGQWLLTAAHCGSYPDAFNDPTGERVGLANRENWEHDVLLVSAPVLGGGRVHIGGPNEVTSLAVGGWAHTFPGEVYCQSGVTTARVIGSQLCGLRVLPDFTKRLCGVDSDGDNVCATDLASAQDVNGGLAARAGDSGGPVYGIGSDNKAYARGLVSGTPDGGRTLYFQDFATVYNDMAVWPVTV